MPPRNRTPRGFLIAEFILGMIVISGSLLLTTYVISNSVSNTAKWTCADDRTMPWQWRDSTYFGMRKSSLEMTGNGREVTADRTPESILQVIRKNLGSINEIYSNYLQFHPEIAGKITIKFTIAPNGKIVALDRLSSATGCPALDRALFERVKTMRFPLVKSSGNTSVTYAFVLGNPTAFTQAQPVISTPPTDPEGVGASNSRKVVKPQLGELVIESDKRSLRVDGDSVLPVIVNPKDGYPDFPDSAYTGFHLPRVKRAAEQAASEGRASTRVAFHANLPFAVLKPVLVAAAIGGYHHVTLADEGRTSVPIELYADLLDSAVMHSSNGNNHDVVVQIAPREIRIYSNTPGHDTNLVAKYLTDSANVAPEVLGSLDSLLISLREQDPAIEWIAVEPAPITGHRKLMGVLSAIHRGTRGDVKRQRFSITLFGVFIPWKNGYFQRAPSAPPPAGWTFRELDCPPADGRNDQVG